MIIAALVNVSSNSNPHLVTCPRRFGKSLNMDMIASFFELEIYPNGTLVTRNDLHSEAVKDTPNYQRFKHLKIASSKRIMKNYFGKFPVIHITMDQFVIDENLPESMLINSIQSGCMAAIHKAYAKYYYVCNSDSIPYIFRKSCNLWADNEMYTSITTENKIIDALPNLTEILFNFFKRKVIVLVDEYDSVISKTIFMNQLPNSNMNTTLNLYIQILNALLKSRSERVELSMVTGISKIGPALFSEMNNWNKYPFDKKHAFSEFYGFTLFDFESLMQKFSKNEDFKIQAMKYYDGYYDRGSYNRRFNPDSLLKSLVHNEVSEYWSDTGLVKGMSEMFKSDVIYDRLMKMMGDSGDEIEEINVFGQQHVDCLREFITNPNTSDYSTINTFFNVLLDQGYLTTFKNDKFNDFDTDNNILTVRVANEEIRTAILKKLAFHYKSRFPIQDSAFSDMSRVLISLDLKNKASTKECMNNFIELFQTVMNDIKETQKTTTEKEIDGMLYIVLKHAGKFMERRHISTKILYRPSIKTGSKGHPFTPDLVFAWGCSALIIEVKCTPSKTRKQIDTVLNSALRQIKSSFYNNILFSKDYFDTLLTKFEYVLHVVIHVSKLTFLVDYKYSNFTERIRKHQFPKKPTANNLFTKGLKLKKSANFKKPKLHH